jgi:hypothetical protein
MTDQTRIQLDTLMTHIDELWKHLNILFDDLTASDGWGGQHGPDWTFADLPYHLAYCNQDIVIRGIEAGEDLPVEDQELLANVEDLNAWNDRKFAEKPVDQTVAQSVADWRATCERIRGLAAQMSDDDLDKPFWMPLMIGWTTVGEGLEFCRSHDWSEFIQLRTHMGREEPVPSPSITKAYLKRMLSFFPMFLNREAADGKQFTAVMSFTDPGVGAFNFKVADGTAAFNEGEAPGANLVMTQRSDTFEKTLRGILSPAEAMQAGLVQVNDFESLAIFGQLFPMS